MQKHRCTKACGLPGAWAVSPTVQHEGKELLAYAAPSSAAAAHVLVVADARSGNEVTKVELDLPTSRDVSGNLIAVSRIWMAVRVKGQVHQYRCSHTHHLVAGAPSAVVACNIIFSQSSRLSCGDRPHHQ